MKKSDKEIHTPQVKICGLTSPEAAVACVRLGADAVGCVFYPQSPRNVSRQQAAEICAAVGGRVATVGVFVNEAVEEIMEIVDDCGLTWVQLHGAETGQEIALLRNSGLRVIKALFAEKAPFIKDAAGYNADGLLVECGQGRLPGGNALAWDWGRARSVPSRAPLILAGGLALDNVIVAITAALPDAIDVSSGVEAAPGQKDLNKVEALITAVGRCAEAYPEGRTIRRLFS